MKRPILITALCCMAIHAQASIQRSISFTNGDVNVGETVVSGVTCSTISMEGWSQTVGSNDYLVPAKFLTFSVPYNAENISVSVGSVSTYFDITLPHPLAKETYATADGNFASGAVIPGGIVQPFDLVKIESVGFMGGNHKIVTIRISPTMVRDSIQNKVRFFNSFDYTINWDFSAPQTASITPITSNSPTYNSDAINSVKKIVENPQQVLFNGPGDIDVMPLTTDQEDWPYIIITPAKFAKKLERLAAIRQARGYGAKVFTIESILQDSRFSDGDTESEIIDDAGKLRAFLKYAFKSYGTRIVLLAGDGTIIPVRYGRGNTIVGLRIATDLYYSELNNKWIQEEDNTYSPMGSDYLSELSVGRIPFESEEDIDNYISKILNYEYNPGLGDSEYLNKMFYTRQDTIAGDGFNDDTMANLFNAYGVNNIIDLSEKHNNRGVPTGAQVAAALTATPCGFHQFVGHGNPGGVGVSSPLTWRPYGLVAYDDYESWHRDETGNGLDCVNAERYPGWSFSISCKLMPYDNSYPQLGKRTFGAAYLLEKNFGGVAFLGNTGSSYISDGVEMLCYLGDKFAELNTSIATRTIEAGELMAELRAIKGITYYERLMHNLYGDPAALLWIREPHKIQYTETETDSLGRYYQFTDNLPAKVTIARRNLHDGTYASMTEIASSQLSSYKFLDGYEYMVLGDDILPLILPLKLTNIIFRSYGPSYIFAKDVSISRNPLAHESDFYCDGAIFESQSDVTIEATGKVNITEALKLRSGAKLTINAQDSVHIEYVTVPAGATLIINAKGIDIMRESTLFAPGSTVILNGEDVSERMFSKRRDASMAESMVVEGRTWWYEIPGWYYDNEDQYTEGEIGLTIGGTIEKDGQIWHIIKMRIGGDVNHASNKIVRRYDSDEPIAYIRQDGGDVYAMEDETCSYELDCLNKTVCGSLLYRAMSKVYHFGNVGETGIMYEGLEGSFSVEYKIIEKIEDSEGALDVYKCAVVNNHNSNGDERYFYITNTVGLTSRGTVGSPGDSELFYSPFGGRTTGIAKYNSARLRYVTDGENNTVIFTAKGGYRLWENYSGVDNVIADGVADAPVYYNMQGQPVSETQPGNLYIRKADGRTTKVIAK